MKLSLFISLAIKTLFFFQFLSAEKAHGADFYRLNQLFQKHFWGSFYKENKCGPNIEYFVRLALKENINLEGAAIIHIENKGLDTFGMVAAVRAREQGQYFDSTGPHKNRPSREAGEVNWFYHAVLLADGFVFDFDFENEPKALPFEDYIHEMFIPEAKKLDSVFYRTKLSGYALSFYDVKNIEPEDSFRVPRSELLDKPREVELLRYLRNGKTLGKSPRSSPAPEILNPT